MNNRENFGKSNDFNQMIVMAEGDCDKNTMKTVTSSKCTSTDQTPQISNRSHSSWTEQCSSTVFSRQDRFTTPVHKIKSKTFRTNISDYLQVLVFLTILSTTITTYPVFAKPYPAVINRHQHQSQSMSSLETELRSPCGEDAIKHEITRANVQDILKVIISQTANAKLYAFQDIESYLKVVESPETRLKDYHETWSSKVLNWLYPHGKELQKEFLAPIPSDIRAHFAATGRDFDLRIIVDMLQDCDERFQLLLVGFHHMLELHTNQRFSMELEKYNPLHTILSRVKNNTRLVLCEIRSALQKLGASYTIVDPSTVKSSKQENENTPFYEWIVFREYLNQLEYLHQVIEAIDENINLPNEQKILYETLTG